MAVSIKKERSRGVNWPGHLYELFHSDGKFDFDEWHAWWTGMGEGFNPLPPHIKAGARTYELIEKERWYYIVGRAFGLMLLLLFLRWLIGGC